MNNKLYTLEALAKLAAVEYSGNPNAELTGVNSLNQATDCEVSFLHNEKYISQIKTTRAGAICVTKETLPVQGKNFLFCDDPSVTFEAITKLLVPDYSKSGFTNIHPTACIHPTALIGKNPSFGPYVVIDKDVTIGNDAIIHSHVTIGPNSSLGDDCLIHAGVVIRENSRIGNQVILQPNCVIGSCGFGYNSSKKTGQHSKITHLGNVVIEDDVEIGACTTIDRARFSSTIIKKGSKIDNQCMIAHNCEIGENNLIVSMSGIAGSTKTGKNVVIAAQCGLVGHIEIGNNVTLGARSAPIKSIKEPGVYLGAPAQPIKQEAIQMVAIRKLPDLLKKFKAAEKFLTEMQESSSAG
jgi:UDP-3-O-[3-hydroxymyristoyl] glucosamine N-acyltransferase